MKQSEFAHQQIQAGSTSIEESESELRHQRQLHQSLFDLYTRKLLTEAHEPTLLGDLLQDQKIAASGAL